jgi:hypothetical protein
MVKKSNDIEDLKLFITSLMNKEQADHSKIIADLKIKIYGTKEYDDAVKLLTKIYEARQDILEKIFNEIV